MIPTRNDHAFESSVDIHSQLQLFLVTISNKLAIQKFTSGDLWKN